MTSLKTLEQSWEALRQRHADNEPVDEAITELKDQAREFQLALSVAENLPPDMSVETLNGLADVVAETMRIGDIQLAEHVDGGLRESLVKRSNDILSKPLIEDLNNTLAEYSRAGQDARRRLKQLQDEDARLELQLGMLEVFERLMDRLAGSPTN